MAGNYIPEDIVVSNVLFVCSPTTVIFLGILINSGSVRGMELVAQEGNAILGVAFLGL